MTTPNGRKISNFLTKQTIPDTAFISFIDTGQNFKISKANFLTALGVTGTLEQQGDISGAPVLNKSGTVNYIRNIEAGSGIKTSISPSEGVLIEHNFTQDPAGAPVLLNPTAESPIIASIAAGTGVSVASDGDRIVVSVSGTPESTKTVLISQESDFPSPVGGIIQLSDNTDYLLVNDVIVTNKFALGANMVIRAAAAGVISLTYTGTGFMFTGADKTFSVTSTTISCPTARLFDISSTAPGAVVQLREVQVASCIDCGVIDGQFITRFDGVSFLDLQTGGFTFTGSHMTLIMDQCVLFLNGGVFLDFGTSEFRSIIIQNQIVEASAPGTVFIIGLVDSGNIVSGGLASVTNCRIQGDATDLVGITDKDVLWEFFGNNTIPDTRPDALINTSNNLTETVLTQNVPTKINAVWVIEGESHYTSDTTGRITYNGDKDFTSPIDLSASLLMASGGDKQVTVYIAINGVFVAATGSQGTASSSKAESAKTIWQHTFKQGDYAEFFVENNSDSTNIVVIQAVGRVN